MHKTPYSSRFIAASNKCTNEPLSGLLTTCLSAVVTHFKEYCNGIFRNTGIKGIINNSQHVINTLQGINASVKAKHFDSYGFSTLYTSIPHVSLKNNLHELIDEAYKVRGAVYLAVNKKGICYWANSRGAYMNINKTELVAMIEYLVDNVFVQVGNKVFRQCVGIPMGTDCAPLLANLYLFYDEYHFMKCRTFQILLGI